MSETAFPGHRLQERREELGLTLDQVYLKLRVAPQFIEALEAGSLDALPGKTYAVGFIKSYCAFLEEDPHPYLAALGNATRPAPRKTAPLFANPKPARRPSWIGEAVTWGTVVGILLAGWIAYSVVVRPDAAGQQGTAAAGTLGAPAVQQGEAYLPGE
jgi:cytoskeleton protein RodZ